MRSTTYADEQFKGMLDDESTYEEGLVFVIMSFSDKLNDTYTAIKDECRKLKLKSVRVDEVDGVGIILSDILDLIERAEFIIVNLTDEKPNVYYELGYAHGVGNSRNDILLVAEEGTKLHFDISLFRVKFYRSTEHLREIVNQGLKSMIKATL